MLTDHTFETQAAKYDGLRSSGGASQLWAGDSDQDLDFDQLDLVQVQFVAKYLTGASATWGEGDFWW